MIDVLLNQLGILPELILQRGLIRQEEACTLVLAEKDQDGREYWLTQNTASAWHVMKVAAQQNHIQLLMISAFRSIQRQADIIQGKLDQGTSIDCILEQCAPPGYSEHHTGRAIDITCPEQPELEICFENTSAFLWLNRNAERYGFSMSYPRQNTSGFQYEPWHWCFHQ